MGTSTFRGTCYFHLLFHPEHTTLLNTILLTSYNDLKLNPVIVICISRWYNLLTYTPVSSSPSLFMPPSDISPPSSLSLGKPSSEPEPESVLMSGALLSSLRPSTARIFSLLSPSHRELTFYENRMFSINVQIILIRWSMKTSIRVVCRLDASRTNINHFSMVLPVRKCEQCHLIICVIWCINFF